MRKLILTLAIFIGFGAANVTVAQSVDQNVTIIVKQITEITQTLDDVTIVIEAAEAGQDPDPVSQSGGNLAVTSNTTNVKKVTARLGGRYYNGDVTLGIKLNVPEEGGVNNKAADFTELPAQTEVELFRGRQMKASTIGIDYQATATYQADPKENGETKKVTFTITDS